VAVPFFCCAMICAIRLTRVRSREAMPRAWTMWTTGGLLFLAAGALQLVPLPPVLQRWIEPSSAELWAEATRMATLSGVAAPSLRPLTLDPQRTTWEVVRVAGILAAFVSASLLVRTQQRRMVLAGALLLASMFQSAYGIREAALQRYAIWGWLNRLVHNRATGTFVNPNHYAHYVAIIVPIAFFLLATAWRDAGRERMPLTQRLSAMIERRPWLTAAGGLSVFVSLAGLMLAQSRGALLALALASTTTIACLSRRKRAAGITALAAAAALVVTLVLLLGRERTIERFMPTDVERKTLVGRTVGATIAVRLWLRFPLMGSGWGTFDEVASLEQTRDVDRLYNHAHNDYLEIASTSGTVGATIAIVTLLAGAADLWRRTWGAGAAEISFRRRAWQAAALTSLCLAMVHALFDFNFFIPANPATLAVILGVAVAPIDYDRRSRR
jgi:O-antigen ligase